MSFDTLDSAILIIDDDVIFTGLLAKVLEQAGYRVDTAHRWEEVQAIIQAHVAQDAGELPYDLILLDLNLPQIGGAEIYRFLRQQSATAQTAIIIVSAISSIEQRVELLDLGADDYIVKPFSIDELVARARVHIRLSHLRRARQLAETQVEFQARHLQAINYVAAIATQHIDLDQMLQQVVGAISFHFAVSYTAVYLVDSDSGEMVLTAVSSPTPHPNPQAQEQAYKALLEATYDQYQTSHQGKQATIPLIRDGVLLGILAVCFPANSTTNNTAIQALETLASQLVTGITNCYLFQDIQQRNQKLIDIAAENDRLLNAEQHQRHQAEELAQLTHLISASLAFDDVLLTGIVKLRQLIQVESCAIFTLDENTESLIYIGVGDDGTLHRLQNITFPTNEGLLGLVFAQKKATYDNNIQARPDYDPALDARLGRTVRAILYVPLLVQDKVVGVVELANKQHGSFEELDRTLATSAASTIAAALDNACLYEEQSRLVEELRFSQEQLIQSEKLAAMGRLAASLAHEINNPLQAVHSCLQLALNFNLDVQKQDQYLNMANEEVERMIDIVSRILDFTRPSARAPVLLSLHQVIREVIQLAQKYTVNNDITIKEERASDLPPVTAVADQIAHVFLNIMLNAFDAMPQTGTLTIKTYSTDEWVIASFQDNGVGMDETVRQRIFEPFFTTKPNAKGLGMTISYGIIERYSGQIKVRSQPDQGTTVTLFLPRAA